MIVEITDGQEPHLRPLMLNVERAIDSIMTSIAQIWSVRQSRKSYTTVLHFAERTGVTCTKIEPISKKFRSCKTFMNDFSRQEVCQSVGA